MAKNGVCRSSMGYGVWIKMTKPLVILTAIALLLAAAWLSLGGVWLAAIIATVTLVAVVLSAFSLGSWWSAKLMREGAQIALQAQVSDDKRDSVLIREIGQLARKSQSPSGDSSYPLLPFGENEAVEGSFSIAGLEESEE